MTTGLPVFWVQRANARFGVDAENVRFTIGLCLACVFAAGFAKMVLQPGGDLEPGLGCLDKAGTDERDAGHAARSFWQ